MKERKVWNLQVLVKYSNGLFYGITTMEYLRVDGENFFIVRKFEDLIAYEWGIWIESSAREMDFIKSEK